jgi:hypothetical protein
MLLQGCAQNAHPASMIALPASGMDASNPAPANRRISIVDVTGGGGLGWIGESNVPNAALQSALEQSLKTAGYLANDSAHAGIDLTVQLIRLDRPRAPAKIMRVKSVMRYTLVERVTRSTMLADTISTIGHADSGDAFWGTTRVRLAIESAIRMNITCFLGVWRAYLQRRDNQDHSPFPTCADSVK